MNQPSHSHETKNTVLHELEDSPLKAYEVKQAEVLELLKQIQVGLERHDQRAKSLVGHHWGHVGDLIGVVEILTEACDRLHLTGRHTNGS